MADRNVIIRQDGRTVTYATDVITSPRKFKYFLFGTSDRKKAKVMTERAALKVLDSWRTERIDNANKCAIEPAG